MSHYSLELYYYDACPFCARVLNSIEKLNLKVTYNNTMENSAHAKKLFNDTGRGTVPCLYINGKPMHESGDIIRWLNENTDQLEKNGN